ncbi:MAG: ribosome-associated translation inhibitor RaiA [Syntrophorhabdaceae bacterium]|nr:ribosome-associated translation inhibitor RaiA [Syntrophorhabdaceae bacterium]
MDITISFRHIETDDAIKKYVEEKIARLQKFVESPLDVHVVLSLERKYRHRIDVMFSLNGVVINAHEVMDDMRAAVDSIIDKLERRLIRYRDRLKKYREGRGKKSIPDISETGSKIIVTKTIRAKPMDPEEATMQLEASGDNFIIFSNTDRGNICVVYKRKDGNYGLIETTGKPA